MTEPVVYLHEYSNGEIVYSKSIVSAAHKTTPLYTADQLHQRVKMTQAEFDRFEEITSKYDFISQAINSICFIGNEKEIFENEIRFVKIFMIFHENKQEELIEIVQEKKWFVEKKKFNGDYKFLKINEKDLRYNHLKEQATQFDTKEEAEKWTNPLTEAVELPVEGE